MVRKVLSAKNGVVTEERFQKMKFPQWLFHYTEVMKAEKERDDMFEILLNYMELVGSMANPEMGRKLKEAKDQRKFQQEIKAETFAEQFEYLKQFIPSEIEIKVEGADNKFVLPKYKREKKIGINKGGEDK